MATSPLTAALLNSQMADPTALMINPQMQLAQSMLQQGTDTSPIRSPWQGVARLAQVLAGRKIEGDTMRGMAGAYGQQAATAARLFKEGSIMRNALESENPLTRMMALQQVPKAMLQLNEPHDLSPTQQTTQPGADGPLATSNLPMTQEGLKSADMGKDPNLVTNNSALAGAIERSKTDAQNQSNALYAPGIAGATEAAKNQPLIQRAGGIAAAEAPYQVADVRPGGAAIPKTSIPGIGVPVGGGSPTVPPQAPPTSVQPSMPPAQTAPGAQPGAQPGLQGGAMAPGTGGMHALPGGGVAIPNPEIIKPLIDSDTKETALDRENALKGQNDQATITAIRDFLPKVKTGWSAGTKLEAGQILQGAGVDPKEIQNLTSIDPASGQVLQKKFLELSTAAARTLGAREPGSVISMFTKAYPSLETTPEAINLQTNALYMDRQRQQALAQAKTNYLNQSVNDYQNTGEYRGLKGFNEAFSKTDAPEDYLRAAEAMSGAKWAPWSKVNDPEAQHRIVSLIPKGTQFVGPDGKMYVRQ
jgi:hypothetical protein